VSTPEIFYWDGLLPVLQHFRAKSRSPGVRGFKRRNKVIVPAGRRNWTIEVPGSDAPGFLSFCSTLDRGFRYPIEFDFRDETHQSAYHVGLCASERHL
jgi:hypothetical protein